MGARATQQSTWTGAVVTEIKPSGFRRWQVVTCVGSEPSVTEVEAEGIHIFAGKKVDTALLKEAPIQERFFTSGGGWHRYSRGHQKALEKGYYEKEPAAKAWAGTFLSVWKPGAALASGGGYRKPPLPERLTVAELATQIRRISPDNERLRSHESTMSRRRAPRWTIRALI